MTSTKIPRVGLGVRPPHYAELLAESARPPDFVEVISENFLRTGGKPRFYVGALRERYPLALHGVSLSIGSVDPLDDVYLRSLRALIDDVEPFVVSDHLCFTRAGDVLSHDLLPLPATEECLEHVCARVHAVQERLGRTILLENPSTYLRYAASTLDTATFLNVLCARTGCGVLLDVNNLYVDERNHGEDAAAVIDALDASAVKQMHVAGHDDRGAAELVIDTHDRAVADAVWRLLARAAARFDAAVLFERDAHLPPLGDLLDELQQAKRVVTDAVIVERSAHAAA